MREVTFQTLIDEGVLQIGDGYRAKLEELGGLGYPFLRSEFVDERNIAFDEAECFHNELAPKLKAKLSCPGDTVITTKGNSTGRAAYVRPNLRTFVYSPHLSFWRSLNPDALHPGFLREWAHSPEFIDQLNGMKDSTDMAPYLSLTDQRRLRITVPDPEQQRAIARVLGVLDDKIELNRRMNQTLEELAGALFRMWFVDFDPVVAKAAGRAPFGLAPPVAALFPAAFADSALGPIPRAWRTAKVSELASMSRGGISPGDFPTEAFDHYSIPAFDDGRKPQPELGSTIKSNKFPVPVDCVLVSKLNPRTPRVWMPELGGEFRGICSTEFLVMIPKPPITREFLFCLFSSDTFTSEFATFVTGTSGSHQRVKPESLLGMDAIIPPAPLVKRFSEIVRPWLGQVAHNIRESGILAALRDTLLPKLLSGELRVKDAPKVNEANA